MKNVLLITLCFLCGLSTSLAKSPKWIDGTWEGTGYQVDGKTWSVQFSKEGDQLTIQYPSLGCSGNWKITKASKTRIDLEEIITAGTDKCDQGCKVVIFKIDDHQLSIVYSLPSYQKDAIAYAVLVKN